MRIPTYESHQNINSVNATTNPGSVPDASAFLSASGVQAARGLDRLADGLDKLGTAIHRENIRERQEQLDLDLLRDMQAYQADSAAFIDDYAAGNQGANARNAAEAGTAWHQTRLAALREKYASSPQGLKYIEARGGALALSGINALRDYSRKEGEAYKNSVYEGELAQARRALTDHNTPDEARAAVLDDLRRKTMGFYGGKGLDGEAAMAKLELFERGANAEMWQNRLAHLRETNPEEAARLTRAAMGGGGSVGAKARAVSLPPDVTALITREAEAAGVDPALALAVCARESGGRADAVSKAGARGLMQLMPGTAKDLGVNPDNPEECASGGVRYLKQMLDRYGGDKKLALMAYNWGPGNVDAYVKTGRGAKGQPLPEETQKYAPAILEGGASGAAEGGGDSGRKEGGASSGLSRALSPQQLETELHKAESEARRRESERAATEADDMALGYLARVQGGEDFEAVHKDVLSLDSRMRGPVNQLFQAHHKDWHNANVRKANDAVVDNRAAMADMTLGRAYTFVQSMPESTPLERMVKKQAQADYALAAQHGGLHKTTDPNVYSDLVESVHYGEIRDEKALRAHPKVAAVAENDVKKLLDDIKGGSTLTEKSLQTAYRWSIGKDENDPKAGSLSDGEKRDFMKFSDWARKAAGDSARAGDPEYARTLARMWRMDGESRSRIHPGYGNDQRYGQGMDDPSWLPELKGEYRTLVNQKFRENPALAAQWAARYENNTEWGMRGYLKALLARQLEPRKRPAAGEPSGKMEAQ